MHLIALLPFLCLCIFGVDGLIDAHVNSSSLKTGTFTSKPALNGNSTSPSHAFFQGNITALHLTYNVWTINSTDEKGNQAIWKFLVSLGVDEANINVLGLPPGLYDTDAFQLKLNSSQYKDFHAGVSTFRLIPRKAERLLYV